MAYSSYRQRSSSPLRHYRSSPMDANMPGLSQFLAPTSSLSTQYSKTGSLPRTRSVTPTRRMAASPAISPSTFKFKFGSPSLPSPTSVFSGAVSPTMDSAEFQQISKENVSVTVRFRPLSLREIHKGDDVAWYADGDTTVRSEYNPATAYSFDRVFGPATTTRCVYDVAARQVVHSAMEGINGTVFAYGVTSSGKTHTMHGDHKSPGIIPLAVKDVFNIIQDTPGREYLLRVSYLEIYNEVINDLLDPVGQNLRIREDSLGTYVEGIKEELVLSPAHALSLIAAGEEHRHVGSNNFNLLSSRSHTIFTLTVESSLRTADQYDNEVTLSQLNLIDLAGSESSKTEITGLRRKEGSYINKSLLTLGTVIAKLSDGRASHVPYRDSKLTRLLQFSLSGHARVSLICTLTPASSNIEETHNTLKFAHRAKHVAIHAAPNRIMDEKSLIKKYQKEISSLKQELAQLRRGVFDNPYLIGMSQEDFITLRQQFEAGQVKLQSRLEEEEQAKAALLCRIQRLTKLILVSTKNSTLSQGLGQQAHRRRHSFGEEELNCLGDTKYELATTFNDDSCLDGCKLELNSEGKININGNEEIGKNEKKSKRRGMLGWFKLRKNENIYLSPERSLDVEISPNLSPASAAPQLKPLVDLKGGCRRSCSLKFDELTRVVDSFPEFTQAGELFSAAGRHGLRPPPTGETMADQMDLLREQVKLVSGEVAFCTSSLKRMSEQALMNPDDVELQAQMEKMKGEIQEKKLQIQILEHRIIGTGQAAWNNASPVEMSETISKLMGQLSEKEFELEIRSADNRILQEQLQIKISEIKKLQDSVALMQQQYTTRPETKPSSWGEGSVHPQSLNKRNGFVKNPQINGGLYSSGGFSGDLQFEETEANGSDSGSCSSKGSSKKLVLDLNLQSKMLIQASEIENLTLEKVRLVEENGGLQIQSQKLAEEASYAKELASAAAVELKNLAEEVTKLSLQNSNLANDLAAAQESAFSRASGKPSTTNGYMKNVACIDDWTNSQVVMMNQTDKTFVNRCFDIENEVYDDIDLGKLDAEDMKRELHARMEREAALKASLAEKGRLEIELRKKLEEGEQREAHLENDLTVMWVLVARLQKEKMPFDGSMKTIHNSSEAKSLSNENDFFGFHEKISEVQENAIDERKPDERQRVIDDLQPKIEEERRRNVDIKILDSHLKARSEDEIDMESEGRLVYTVNQRQDEQNSHVGEVLFDTPNATLLHPC